VVIVVLVVVEVLVLVVDGERTGWTPA